MSRRLINYLKFSFLLLLISFFMGSRGFCLPHDFSLSIFTFIVLSIFIFQILNWSPVAKLANKISIHLFWIPFVITFLSVISLPNVYCGTNKISEAKIHLAALYSIEIDAKTDDDHFTSCLIKNGFQPTPRGYYVIGFGSFNKATTDYLKKTSPECLEQTVIVPDYLLSKNLPLIKSALKNLESNINNDHFKAYAIGDLGGAIDESELDIWSINEKKELVHEQKGRRFIQRDLHERVKNWFKR